MHSNVYKYAKSLNFAAFSAFNCKYYVNTYNLFVICFKVVNLFKQISNTIIPYNYIT